MHWERSPLACLCTAPAGCRAHRAPQYSQHSLCPRPVRYLCRLAAMERCRGPMAWWACVRWARLLHTRKCTCGIYRRERVFPHRQATSTSRSTIPCCSCDYYINARWHGLERVRQRQLCKDSMHGGPCSTPPRQGSVPRRTCPARGTLCLLHRSNIKAARKWHSPRQTCRQ